MPTISQSHNKNISLRSTLLVATALGAASLFPAIAHAQNRAPAVYNNVDENGVDLVLGTFEQAFTSLTIGSGEGALAYGFSTAKGVWGANSFTGGVEVVGTIVTVYIGGDMERFTISGATYTSQQGEGSTLTLAGGLYTYMRDDGTVIMFDQSKWPVTGTANALPISIKTPEGSAINIYYKTVGTAARIQSVTNNRGYQLKYNYPSATSPMVSGVTAINNGVDYCDPIADTCASLTQSWPTMAVRTSSGAMTGANVYTITDAASRTSRFTVDAATRLTEIKRPSTGSNIASVIYSAGGTVASVTTNAVTHNYNYVVNNNIATMTRTNPFGATVTAVSNLAIGRPSSVTNELGFTTSYTYDASGRLTRVQYPEGNAIQYTYDARGNVTSSTSIAKPGSALANIITSATYPATCTNPRTCNSPVTTSDAKGNVTDYSYDVTTGVATSVTAPAAVAGGVRPQTRASFATVQAYYKNATGAVVASGQPIMVPTGTSTCQTLATCAGGADEVKTVISYGPQSVGVANNLLPVAASSGSGDGALTSSVSVAYDIIGNRISVDGPLAGAADTTRVRYNAVRQVVGVATPDPDGVGPLKHRAQRLTYNADGQPTYVEVGTVLSQSEADWAGFVSLQQAWTYYDAHGRTSRESVSASGVNYSVVDYSYDGLGRLDCAAQRLNPAVWGVQEWACSAQAAGASGPDRISRTLYNEVGQVTQVQSALGTPAQQTVVQSYRANGPVETLTDGKGNRTTYEYDGFDRLSKTRFPSPTTSGTSSVSDYEVVDYDANSNIVQRRLRDGKLISYAIDALNRVIFKNLVGDAPNVSYSFDLLGRLKSATKSDGYASSFTYDALGRVMHQVSPFGWIYSQYDAAGRRIRLAYQDGFYVTYDTLVTGETTAIREYGGVALGTYAYDDLGRRTSLTRGNGTVTSYSYDPASRLTSLAHDFAGTAQDVMSSFTYNAASQIASRTRSNDLFAWNGAVAVNRAYTNNGLNQHTQSGPTALGYDGRGNLTSAGSDAYAYTSENYMKSALGKTLFYDPLGRLALTDSGTTTQFEYDGDVAVREIGATALIRRHVHGPGSDEPLLTYEGSSLTDKRYLHADERGSIVALSNASGQVTQINAYDDYGIPQGKNATGAVITGGTATAGFGRFGYTGQTWLPEVGLSYYKARMYSPTLGRFMQTDPIGYGDGVNQYAYVGGDPINGVDPSGLREKSVNLKTKLDGSGSGSSSNGGATGSDRLNPGVGTNIAGATCQSCAGSFPGSMSTSSTFNFRTSEFGTLVRIKPDAVSPVDGDTTTVTSNFRFVSGTQITSSNNLGTGPSSGSDGERPAYCRSVIFRIGSVIDNIGAGGQALGVGTVIAGGAVGLATAVTGVGAGAGGTIAAGGVTIYSAGTAVSAVGNIVKFLGGQSGGLTSANLLSYPTVRIKSIAQIPINTVLSYYIDSSVIDPCG